MAVRGLNSVLRLGDSTFHLLSPVVGPAVVVFSIVVITNRHTYNFKYLLLRGS